MCLISSFYLLKRVSFWYFCYYKEKSFAKRFRETLATTLKPSSRTEPDKSHSDEGFDIADEIYEDSLDDDEDE